MSGVSPRGLKSAARRAAAVWCLIAAPCLGVINGDIIRVGFPAVGGGAGGRDMIRRGAWVPVVVDLTLEGQASFDGWIRVLQEDKDGDQCFDMQPVQLRADSGATRRYWLYVVASPRLGEGHSFAVEVLSRENRRVDLMSGGRRVRSLKPAQPPEALASDQYLILSVSPRTAGKVATLASPEHGDEFANGIRVAHIDPRQLPNRWLGLEAVDAVVWDEADPADAIQPISPEQIEALLEWTRQGGTLVLAAGRTADSLRESKLLNPVLPADPGEVVATGELPNVRRRLLEIDPNKPYAQPLVVARCTVRRGAGVLVEEILDGAPTALITTRRLDRGRVVFVATPLRNLFAEDGNPVTFFKSVLLLTGPKPTIGYNALRLLDELEGWVGFRQVGAFYVALAFLFAVAYVVAATFGTWGFLRNRGWLKQSWSVFAVAAGVASLLSILGVQAARGVGKKLVQLSVVDAELGQSWARATTYFGLKTSLHGLVDVWLPQEYPQQTEPDLTDCFLKPLPSSNESTLSGSYADPGRYRLVPSQAELRDVPIRGTLKQFEGRWAGVLDGRIQANITLLPGPEGRDDLRLASGSTIVNGLGVDLYRCYLIYAARDVVVRGAPDRSEAIYVIPLGPLDDGATYTAPDDLYVDERGMEMELKERQGKQSLQAYQRQWRGPFSLGLGRATPEQVGLERHVAALLLATTLGDYVAEEEGYGRLTGMDFRAELCRHLDLSGWLDTGAALFIGFARDPGPVTLCARTGVGPYEPVPVVGALTMYRILIPLR